MSSERVRRAEEQLRRERAEANGRARENAAEPWEPPIPLSVAPAVAPFPAEVFPAPLRRFADEAASAVGCPVDYLGVPMLAVAGGAIGASKALAVKKGYVQRPLLYAVIVGPPGDGKTPALSLVASPLHEAQQRARAIYEQAVELYEDETAREERKEKPTKPVLHRVHVEDATVESLAPILVKNPRGVIMVRDEAAAWVTSANQYKGGKGSDRQFWLANWSGMPACIDRKAKEEPIILPHPFIALVGGIQPDVLGVLADPRGRCDGSIDRILFAFPDARPAAEWSWEEIAEEAVAPWRDTVQQLLALNMEPGAHGLRPFVVGLTPDARPRWQALMDSLVYEVNGRDFPPHLRGPWAKLKVYAARLALILHFIRFVNREADTQTVDEESVRRAALLVSYFKTHTRKVLAALSADPRHREARRALRWIANSLNSLKSLNGSKEVSKSELHAGVWGGSKSVDEVSEVIGLLVRHGWLRLRPDEKKAGPGRRASPRYEIHPSLTVEHSEISDNSENSPVHDTEEIA